MSHVEPSSAAITSPATASSTKLGTGSSSLGKSAELSSTASCRPFLIGLTTYRRDPELRETLIEPSLTVRVTELRGSPDTRPYQTVDPIRSRSTASRRTGNQ